MDERDLKINTLENNYKSMSEKIDDLKKSVNEGFEDIKEEIKCFRDYSDNKYASKLTEKIVYAMASMILLAFFGGIITLIIK